MSISLRTLVAVVAVLLFGARAQSPVELGPGTRGSREQWDGLLDAADGEHARRADVYQFGADGRRGVARAELRAAGCSDGDGRTTVGCCGRHAALHACKRSNRRRATPRRRAARSRRRCPADRPSPHPSIRKALPATRYRSTQRLSTPLHKIPDRNTACLSTARLSMVRYKRIVQHAKRRPRPLGQTPYTPGSTSAALANPYAGQEMPMGNLARQEISPYAKPQSPPSQSAWVPTKVASLMPRSWTGSGAVEAPAPMQPSYGAYGAYGGGGSGGGSCDPNACYGPPPTVCCPPENWCDNIGVLTSYTAFKNGIDLDGQNANFGTRYGVFGAAPLLREWGIGAQGGSTVGWTDWKGSQYTGDDTRFQNFITAGVFQRPCGSGFGWAIVHDWLRDDFYANMQFTQFRVAGAYQFMPGSEIGIWAALPQGRDETFVGTPAVLNRFQTLLQGNLYWQQAWSDWAWSNVFIGMGESPSDITYAPTCRSRSRASSRSPAVRPTCCPAPAATTATRKKSGTCRSG